MVNTLKAIRTSCRPFGDRGLRRHRDRQEFAIMRCQRRAGVENADRKPVDPERVVGPERQGGDRWILQPERSVSACRMTPIPFDGGSPHFVPAPSPRPAVQIAGLVVDLARGGGSKAALACLQRYDRSQPNTNGLIPARAIVIADWKPSMAQREAREIAIPADLTNAVVGSGVVPVIVLRITREGVTQL